MCACNNVINEKLKLHNAKLAGAFSIDAGKLEGHSIIITTETTTPGRRRKSVPLVLASHCPFCGEKLQKED